MNEKTDIDELISTGERELGHYFVVERQAQKLSQEQVAKQLKLDVKIVRALESNDFEMLPSAIFVTGYIRNYAKLLQIPAEPLVNAYKSRHIEEPKLKVVKQEGIDESFKPSLIPDLGKLKTLVVLLLIIGGGFFAAQWYMQQGEQSQGLPPLTQQLEEPSSLLTLPEAATPTSLSDTSDATETPLLTEESASIELPGSLEPEEISPEPEEISPELTDSPEGITESAANQTSDTSSLQVTTNELVVELSLSDESWLNIRTSDGDRLLYGLKPAGFSTTLHSNKLPLRVFLGNAPGVTLTVDGKTFDVQSYSDEKNVARFTLDKQ